MADLPPTIAAPRGAIATGDRVDERPEPLTHAECDLRDFPYMPLDVMRLRDSETAVLLSDAEFRAAILLWCAAWHQVPAASVPADDRLLASLAGYGRDLKGWLRVKDGALRGFVECSDGRLYHAIVAQKAAEAWGKKWDRPDKAAERSEHARKAAEARWSHKRSDAQAMPEHVPEQSPTHALNREERKASEKERVVDGGGSARPTKPIPGEGLLIAGNLWKQFCTAYRGPISKAAEGRFRALLAAGENADPIIAAAPRANPDTAAEQWLDERAWMQPPLLPPEAPKKPLISAEADEIAREIAKVAGQDWEFLDPGWCGAPMRCQAWLSEGWMRDEIVAGVRAQVTARAPEKISNVNYFEKGLARFIALQRRPVPEVIEHQAQTVEVRRGPIRDGSRSGVAAIGRVYAQMRAAAAEGQHGSGGEVPEALVQRLPS
jgi:Protein of unknown function (DUF1376)